MWNYIEYLFWPWYYEARNQLKGKKCKKHKHIKAKQKATKQTIEKQPTEKIKKEKKNLEMNENENTVLQNLWGAAKAVLRLGNFIMIQFYLRKQKYLINNLTLHLKQLEKDE